MRKDYYFAELYKEKPTAADMKELYLRVQEAFCRESLYGPIFTKIDNPPIYFIGEYPVIDSYLVYFSSFKN